MVVCRQNDCEYLRVRRVSMVVCRQNDCEYLRVSRFCRVQGKSYETII